MLQKHVIVLRHMGHIMLDRFHSHLRGTPYSRTTARDAVFLALYRLGRCRRTDVRAALQNQNIDRVTVYRTLKLFLEAGIAHELVNGQIELSDRFSQHHHHFSCSQCGREISFNDNNLEQALTRLAQLRGLVLEGHAIELTGRCSSC